MNNIRHKIKMFIKPYLNKSIGYVLANSYVKETALLVINRIPVFKRRLRKVYYSSNGQYGNNPSCYVYSFLTPRARTIFDQIVSKDRNLNGNGKVKP